VRSMIRRAGVADRKPVLRGHEVRDYALGDRVSFSTAQAHECMVSGAGHALSLIEVGKSKGFIELGKECWGWPGHPQRLQDIWKGQDSCPKRVERLARAR